MNVVSAKNRRRHPLHINQPPNTTIIVWQAAALSSITPVVVYTYSTIITNKTITTTILAYTLPRSLNAFTIPTWSMSIRLADVDHVKPDKIQKQIHRGEAASDCDDDDTNLRRYWMRLIVLTPAARI